MAFYNGASPSVVEEQDVTERNLLRVILSSALHASPSCYSSSSNVAGTEDGTGRLTLSDNTILLAVMPQEAEHGHVQ